MPINGHGQNMLGGGSNGLLNVCVNNATSPSNTAKVRDQQQMDNVFDLERCNHGLILIVVAPFYVDYQQ